MPFGVIVLAKPRKYCSLACLTLSRSVCICSSGSICRSLTECPGLQKCSATPDLSVFLLMMSLRCSLSLSRCRLQVCPMYWQLSFPFYIEDNVSRVAVKSLFYGKRLVGVRKSDSVIPIQYLCSCVAVAS